MQRYHVRARSNAGASTIYAMLLDGLGWPRWMAVGTVEIEHAVDGQVGEVRRFATGRHVSIERIVALEPNRRFAYTVESALFTDYLGEIELTPVAGGGTLIDWRATFSMRRALFAWPMKLFLARFMRRSARKLAQLAEASAAAGDRRPAAA